MTRAISIAVAVAAVLAATSCRPKAPATSVRATGYVEATEVQVSPQVGGRILAIHFAEGDRVAPGQALAELDTTDTALALRRARADRDQADAQTAAIFGAANPTVVAQAQPPAANVADGQ